MMTMTNKKTNLLNACLALVVTGTFACTTSGKKESAETPPAPANSEGVFGAAADPGTLRNSFVIEMAGAAAVWSSQDPAKWLDATVFAQIEKGDAEGAERNARALLAKNPADPQAMLALSASLLVSRNVELADYYATRVASMQSIEQASALNIRGICRVLFAVATGRSEDYDDAANFFRNSLAANGNQVAAALNLGELELVRNRAGEAVSAFSQAAGRCQECRPALYGWGLAAMRARQFDTARDQFKTLAKRDPSDDEANYQLALAEAYGFKEIDRAARILKDLATGSKDMRIRAMAESVLRKLRGSGGNL
ncbi:MAG: hypothetical protein RIQ81_275 [Pseudomonadota bacterium]|jgi:Flp pilus assembly protein TadD